MANRNDIPDLWPSGLRVTEISPLMVLKVQAAKLKERTAGVLTAEVATRLQSSDEPGRRTYCQAFEVVAPALGYREELFQVRHDETVVYPASIWAGDADDELREYSESHDQEQFLRSLGNLLQSRLIQTHLQGLIARSNEIAISEHA